MQDGVLGMEPMTRVLAILLVLFASGVVLSTQAAEAAPVPDGTTSTLLDPGLFSTEIAPAMQSTELTAERSSTGGFTPSEAPYHVATGASTPATTRISRVATGAYQPVYDNTASTSASPYVRPISRPPAPATAPGPHATGTGMIPEGSATPAAQPLTNAPAVSPAPRP